MKTWKTGISKVWTKENGELKEAQLFFGNKPVEVNQQDQREKGFISSWLDELFKGGIDVYDTNNQENNDIPITLLIKGPPGSGKTTFALELCYRLAENARRTSMYVSLESGSQQIIDNAKRFGWDQDENRASIMGIAEKTTKKKFRAINSCLNVLGSEITTKWAQKVSKKAVDNKVDMTNALLKTLATFLGVPYSPSFINLLRTFYQQQGLDNFPVGTQGSQILVIDSLNIFPIESRKDIFMRFLNIAKLRKKIAKNNKAIRRQN